MIFKKRIAKAKKDLENDNQSKHRSLSVVIDGKEIPVVPTIQAIDEWSVEYRRAQIYRNISIVELICIIVLAAMMFL